jgi:hypothetical protein
LWQALKGCVLSRSAAQQHLENALPGTCRHALFQQKGFRGRTRVLSDVFDAAVACDAKRKDADRVWKQSCVKRYQGGEYAVFVVYDVKKKSDSFAARQVQGGCVPTAKWYAGCGIFGDSQKRAIKKHKQVYYKNTDSNYPTLVSFVVYIQLQLNVPEVRLGVYVSTG